MARIKGLAGSLSFIYKFKFSHMPKRHEFNNDSMNSSSALVAPGRSEIRISFSVEFPTVSVSTKRILRKCAFAVTFLLVFTLSSCSMLDVQMPRGFAVALGILTSVGILYCFHEMWNKFGGWDGIVNHEEE